MSAAASGVRQSVFAALQGRIDAFRAAGGELIPLQIGDTHLPPPPSALGPIDDASELSLYGPVAGLPELREALAARHRARGLDVTPEHVLVGCGCTHAIFCAARALLDPGDDALVASPYWPLITGVLKTCGVHPIEVPLSWPLYDNPQLDLEALLEEHRTEKTRAVYIITPGNPDGQVLTEKQLEQVARFARRHHLWVLADEVYADFVYDGAHRSIAALPGMADRTVTGYSLSKSHALAGARIGYVVGPPRVMAAARRISNHTLYNVPVPMQRAALRALDNDAAWLGEARDQYRAARDAAARALDDIGLVYELPRGGAYFFLDMSERLGGRPLAQLLERAIDEGVLLAPGEAFGDAYREFARLCFTGVPRERVLEGIARFGHALEGFH
ncbi:MAG TPA: pyridoxal phosphate-dependent aminotransferase [Polyangiaceae bacterium]|nr:pyridoxal phosphate-dependent aminotransferase [Polyangiaceae bacterium]